MTLNKFEEMLVNTCPLIIFLMCHLLKVCQKISFVVFVQKPNSSLMSDWVLIQRMASALLSISVLTTFHLILLDEHRYQIPKYSCDSFA